MLVPHRGLLDREDPIRPLLHAPRQRERAGIPPLAARMPGVAQDEQRKAALGNVSDDDDDDDDDDSDESEDETVA